MKITSKGQVTIPQAVREKAGLHPHREVEFEVRDNGEVILRAVTAPATTARAAFAPRGAARNSPRPPRQSLAAALAAATGAGSKIQLSHEQVTVVGLALDAAAALAAPAAPAVLIFGLGYDSHL